MKIGLVIYDSLDTMSGGYLYDRKLVAYLRSQGDTVDVISIPPGLDIVIEDERVHPSVLFANGRNAHMPVVSLVHNLHSSEHRPAWQNAFFRQVERWHIASVDGFIFNSPVTRDTVNQLIRIGKPSVLAPPAGDRLGRLERDVVQPRAAGQGPLRLLFLANVTQLKGLHVLLDGLASLPSGCCLLDVAGSLDVEPGYASQMQRKAAGLPMPVTFHGTLDGPPLVDLLKASDVLVIPSFWEGFGIAYLEGMAFGLPAIGTTAGAIPQMIRDGENGYMIPPGDSTALASIIRRLSSDRALIARLSAGALSYFASCPTWDQSAAIVRAFLLEMTERAHGPRL
jgi:glycosyltransferase involved in cell wall biosynthesis